MANNRFNKQVSPKGYAKGGKVSKKVKVRNKASKEIFKKIKKGKK